MHPFGPFWNFTRKMSTLVELTWCVHIFFNTQDLNPTSLPEALSVILGVVTFVGLGLSIICLVVFFLTYLLSK